MPPTTIEEIRAKIEALLHKIEGKLEEIRQKVNSVLSHVPGFLHWVVDKFMDAWNQMLSKLGEFWDWFTDKLAYAGDPMGLWNMGESWHSVLGEPGKRLADSIDDDQELLVDDNWTGTAATAYASKVPSQETALRSLGTGFASPVASQLKTMAVAIASFWIGIIAAIVSLVIALVAASAATGSVIGIPAVPFAIIAGIVAFLVAAGVGTAALVGGMLLANSGLRDLTRYAEDWPDFALS